MKVKMLLLTGIFVFCGAMEKSDFELLHDTNKVGIFTAQNCRNSQEDTYFHGLVNEGRFCAVYDGHRGSQISQYLSEELHNYFKKEKSDIVADNLLQAFLKCDTSDFVKEKHKTVGSTATVLYQKDGNVWLANTGDSRTIVVRITANKTKVIYATQDHKTNRQDERKRIQQMGGWFYYGRVLGTLSVTRSFGDHDHGGLCENAQGEKKFVKYITPDPDIIEFNIADTKIETLENLSLEQFEEIKITDVKNEQSNKNLLLQLFEEKMKKNGIQLESIGRNNQNEFLIAVLASDGLWDRVGNEEVMQLINYWVKYSKELKNLNKLAQILGAIAINRNSEDNITVMVVDLS